MAETVTVSAIFSYFLPIDIICHTLLLTLHANHLKIFMAELDIYGETVTKLIESGENLFVRIKLI